MDRPELAPKSRLVPRARSISISWPQLPTVLTGIQGLDEFNEPGVIMAFEETDRDLTQIGAHGELVIAVPTLIRKCPPQFRRIIGDMSNTERVLVGLDIRKNA